MAGKIFVSKSLKIKKPKLRSIDYDVTTMTPAYHSSGQQHYSLLLFL